MSCVGFAVVCLSVVSPIIISLLARVVRGGACDKRAAGMSNHWNEGSTRRRSRLLGDSFLVCVCVPSGTREV